MKTPLFVALSVLMALPAPLQAAPNRVDAVVDGAVGIGQQQKNLLLQVLGQIDGNLVETQIMLENSVKSQKDLRKANLLVDGITLGAGLTWLVSRNVPILKSAGGEKAVQAITTGAAVATAMGVITGETLSLMRSSKKEEQKILLRDYATRSHAQLEKIDLSQVDPQIREAVESLKAQMVVLRERPTESRAIESTFIGVSNAAVVTGLVMIFNDYSKGNILMPLNSIKGLGVIGSSTLIRMGSYLTPADQRMVLDRLKQTRILVRNSINELTR